MANKNNNNGKKPPKEEKKPVQQPEAEDLEDGVDIFTLTDEDGNELQFACISTYEEEETGKIYFAMVEVDDDGNEKSDEYTILRVEKDDNGEEMLVTIDDDEEFDRIADYFDDEFNTIDYDADGGDK